MTTRIVAGDPAAYRAAWEAVRARALALGHRAWVFRAAADASRYIEFVEWRQTADSADPRADELLRSALTHLDDFGSANTELWIEP